MSRRLSSYVHVHLPEGGTRVYGPGDVVPDDHAALIANPRAWVEEAPEPAQAPAPPPSPEGPAGGAPAGPPPRSGAGSSAAAWAEYARAHDVVHDEGAGRADIITALTAAGVPVE